MSYTVTIRHNFEAAHRLPHLPGKCQSLHGHSWWAEVTVSAPGGYLNDDSIVMDFGSIKAAVRGWIDTHLDHGVILGELDPLVPVLDPHGKVYVVTRWPTVEHLAGHLAHRLGALLPEVDVVRLHLTEKHDNAATWTP